MKGNHAVPPSAGPNPTWQAIIEVGGSQQIVSAGRFYSCHSLPDVRARRRKTLPSRQAAAAACAALTRRSARAGGARAEDRV